MRTERILSNNITILTSQTNEGKTMLLCNLAIDYLTMYDGNVWSYGIRPQITKQIDDILTFSSVLEMEQIRDSIILIDEVGALFDLDNRKQKRLIEHTLRHVTHNNNRIVMSGLPNDFKKFLASKATCFMWKSLTISDLINGSLCKYLLLQYAEADLGAYRLTVDKSQVICYDPTGYWTDDVVYIKEFDTKINNKKLFLEKL